MVDIVTRAEKGSALTNEEMDANLFNLKAAVEATLPASGGTIGAGGLKISSWLAVGGTADPWAVLDIQGTRGQIKTGSVIAMTGYGTTDQARIILNHNAADLAAIGTNGTGGWWIGKCDTPFVDANITKYIVFDTSGNVEVPVALTVNGSAVLRAADKGAANGVAPLGADAKIAATYLPSYVDDVLEYANYASLPATGESGKIYVLATPYTSGGVTSSQFRWSGSAYAPIVASPGSTDAVTEGATNLYFTYQRVRDAVLTGLSLASGVAITAADSVLSALGKLQKQITDLVTVVAGKADTGHDHTGTYQPLDADLTAIAGLAGTSGVLTKTAANTWTLDEGVMFSAYKSATAQTPAINTNTKVVSFTEEYDIGGGFDGSKFQPSVAGYYQINARVGYAANVTTPNTKIFKNGSVHKVGSIGNGAWGSVVSSLVYLNGTTDYVEIYTMNSTGGVALDYGGEHQIYFNGYLVRRG